MVQQGFYTDPPSRRFGYDEDGTILLRLNRVNDTVLTEYDSTSKKIINDEGSSLINLNPSQNGWSISLCMIFPEFRDITHYVMAASEVGYLGPLEWSADTTTGFDGTWTTAFATFPFIYGVSAATLRNNITPLFLNNVKALRWSSSTGGLNQGWGIHALHIYGMKSAGETPHRIDFCFPDGSELVRDFDYGDQPRGSIRTWSPIDTYNIGSALYLRNRSPDKVANEVVLNMQSLTGNMTSNLLLSKDNVFYGVQISWTTINPLEIVGPIYVKHDVPDGQTLGLYTARLKLVVGEWL
jgi:hypothetical protein